MFDLCDRDKSGSIDIEEVRYLRNYVIHDKASYPWLWFAMKSTSICSIHDEPVSTVSYNSHQSRVLWLSWIVFPTTIDSFIRTCCCHLKNMTVADREKLLMMSPNLSWYGLQNIICCTFPLLVSFQMSSQISCLGWCIIALVAFMRFFTRVSFYMLP